MRPEPEYASQAFSAAAGQKKPEQEGASCSGVRAASRA
jgi:hypothetical protein